MYASYSCNFVAAGDSSYMVQDYICGEPRLNFNGQIGNSDVIID